MTTIPSTSGSTAGASVASSTAAASEQMISSDFETFLKMLTTQMQNQDPLNPIESSDYAVQLATFSGVEQQVKTNTLLESLAGQLNVMGMSGLASWVGMEARAPVAVQFDGTPITVSPNPASTADKAVLVVTNTALQEVDRFEVPISAQPLEWSGVTANGSLLPNGNYSFRLESYRGGSMVLDEQAEVYAPVIEAQGGASGATLILAGGAQVSTTSVTALRAPK